MGITAPKIILLSTFILLLVSIVFICVGATGNSWLEYPQVSHFGLYEFCRTHSLVIPEAECMKRKDILKFKTTSEINLALKDKDLDIVLLLLILSACIAFFSAIFTITMFFANGSNSWRCGAISTGILALLGALLALAGCGHFEGILEDTSSTLSLSDTYDHKWSSIITWVGAMLQVIAAVLAFIMICVRPRPDYSNQGHLVYAQNNVTSYPKREYKMSDKPTYENRGYDGDRRGHQGESRRHQEEPRETRSDNRGYRVESKGENRGYQGESRGNRDRSMDYQDNRRGYEIERRGQENHRRDDDHHRRDNNTRQPSHDDRYESSYNDNRRQHSYDDNERPYTINSSNKVRHPSYDNQGYVLR